MGDLRGVHILWQAEETEYDVKGEEDRAYVLDLEDPVVADVEFDGGEVHRREATVDDHNEHDTVPEVQKGALRVPLHALFAAELVLFSVLRSVPTF